MIRKAYLKYRIIAILGLQIILESEITTSSISDTTMLLVMLDGMKRHGLSPDPTIFNADQGYDSDYNCGILFEMGMIPNIKQRMTAINRGRPNRSRMQRSLTRTGTDSVA